MLKNWVAATVTKPMTPEQIRDALLSLSDSDREFIITNPGVGEHKVFSLTKEGSTGKIVVNCQVVPES